MVEGRDKDPQHAPEATTPKESRQGTFPVEYGALEEIGLWVQELAGVVGFLPLQSNEIELAVTEAVTNVITLGLNENPESSFEVTVSAWPGAIEVVVVDDGPPFDMDSVPEPDLHASLEDRPVGGLGIFLIKQLFDSVERDRKGGRNILTMRRSLPSSP